MNCADFDSCLDTWIYDYVEWFVYYTCKYMRYLVLFTSDTCMIYELFANLLQLNTWNTIWSYRIWHRLPCTVYITWLIFMPTIDTIWFTDTDVVYMDSLIKDWIGICHLHYWLKRRTWPTCLSSLIVHDMNCDVAYSSNDSRLNVSTDTVYDSRLKVPIFHRLPASL